MAPNTIMMKLRRALLCCSKREEKVSLDIVSFAVSQSTCRILQNHMQVPGSPQAQLTTHQGYLTNARKVDIISSLPGLTDAERVFFREKALGSSAIHLLNQQSQPPFHPSTSAPSPTDSPSTSRVSSREPSMAILNAASADLPATLPTPPRQRHAECSPPAARMKTMRERADSPSASVSIAGNDDSLYETPPPRMQKGLSESLTALNLDFDWSSNKTSSEAASLRTINLSEGFEMQDTMGGHSSQTSSPAAALKTLASKQRIKRAITTVSFAESSDSEVDSLVVQESSPLVVRA
jgi:hypothetical protein